MPTEVRHILFRPTEVIQAIKEYHRKLNKPLPAAPVFDCAMECAGPGRPVRFRIIMGPRPGEESPQHLITENEALIAALILHCRERSIPLPAKAEKTLQQFGQQLCLIATTNPKHEKLPQV